MEAKSEAATNNNIKNNKNNNNKSSIANPYLAANNQARRRTAAAQEALPPDSSFELFLPVRQERRTETLQDAHHDVKPPTKTETENSTSSTLDETKDGSTTTDITTITGTASTPLPTPNTGLAYWERLPSNNLTFGSAEILTVEECVKYRDLYRGRAVRVTGQLCRRGFVGVETQQEQQQQLPQVKLELMHIETTTISTARIASKTPVKQSLHPPPTTPAKTSPLPESNVSSHIGPFKTPTSRGAGVQNPLVRSTGNAALSSKRKRPWFATTNNNNSHKKVPPPPPRRLSTPATATTTTTTSGTTPEKFLLQVLVDPELPHLSDLVPSGTTKVTVWGTMLEDGSIQARFVNLVDAQMDMNLYMIALLRRRRWLYQRHHKEQQQQRDQPSPQPQPPPNPRNTEDPAGLKEEKVEETMLIQGCGPPPYEKLLE